MRRFAIIKDSVVVELYDAVDDLCPKKDVISAEFDTIVEDMKNSYIVGDLYDLDDWEVRQNIVHQRANTWIKEIDNKAEKYVNDYLDFYTRSFLPAIALTPKGRDTYAWIKLVRDQAAGEITAGKSDNKYNPITSFNSCGDAPWTNDELEAVFLTL